MRIAGFRNTSLFDGIGINFVIFTQGCGHHCDHCQNPSTWDFDGGTEMSVEDIEKLIEPYIGFITGITFSGGDPVYQLNEVTQVARWASQHSLKTTLYTGFSMIVLHDIDCFDYVVDGEYIDELPSAPFRGSSNQTVYKRTEGKWIEVQQ
jgi:anaerobic ribonucleoside-triphosphate reductase activating protein